MTINLKNEWSKKLDAIGPEIIAQLNKIRKQEDALKNEPDVQVYLHYTFKLFSYCLNY